MIFRSDFRSLTIKPFMLPGSCSFALDCGHCLTRILKWIIPIDKHDTLQLKILVEGGLLSLKMVFWAKAIHPVLLFGFYKNAVQPFLKGNNLFWYTEEAF